MSGSVKLPGTAVEWLLRGALVAASKDDVTPILCAVKWTIADRRVTVTATDRYRVHQLHVPAPEGTPDGEFVMSRDQAKLLQRSWHSPRRLWREQVVVLTWTDGDPVSPGARRPERQKARRYLGSIAFTVLAFDGDEADSLTHETAQVGGNFPPVEKLFPTESTEGEPVSQLMLQPRFLADTEYLRSGYGSLRFVVPRITDGNPHKYPPMLVVNTEGTARALIQPNLYDAAEAKEYGA